MIDILWVLFASLLVFIMQAGFAMVESGMTRSKNSINVAIKNLTDLGVSFLAFWLFGFALLFGASENGFAGSTGYFLNLSIQENPVWTGVFFLFQSMFCSTAATIVSGAVAERMKYASYIISTILLAALIYPIFGHWSWGSLWQGNSQGWLEAMGFVDFAGSTVVHSVGGWIALAALLILGPRKGRFSEPGEMVTKKSADQNIPASNIPMVVLGVILLWFGWFGFNGGSTLALTENVPSILVNTALSASAGMVGALLLGWPFFRRPDVNLVLNGALAGLVAITANAHAVGELQAVVIGLIGGAIMFGSSRLLEFYRIDDAVGAIPVHLFAGIWGTLAVALFGDPEILGTGLPFWEQLLVQALGIGASAAWSFVTAVVLLWIINRIWPLRVPAEHEQAGLNISEHGASTEIHDFFRVLENQAITGDMSLRAPVEPFTEVGQIAHRYNSVLDKLENSTMARDEFIQFLSNINDGILVVDREGRIAPYYSLAAEKILKTYRLEGRNIEDIFSQILPKDVMKQFSDFFELLFQDHIDIATLMKMNPMSKVETFFDNGNGSIVSKFLTVSFIHLRQHDQDPQRIMLVISDTTEEEELSRAMQASRKEYESNMELFYKLIHVDPDILMEFINSSEEHLLSINDILKNDQPLDTRLHKIFNLTHSIKGDAQTIGLDIVADEAHRLEDAMTEMKKVARLKNSDFLELAVGISRLKKLIVQCRELVRRLQNFQTGYLRLNESAPNNQTEHWLGKKLYALVHHLSSDSGLDVNLNTADFHIEDIPEDMETHVKDILIQLIRNSFAHGFESADDRRNQGKPGTGSINMFSSLQDGELQIGYRDDGRGIDFSALSEALWKNGILSRKKADSMDQRELVNYLFTPGVSTSTDSSQTGGRGVGLSRVQEILKGIRGRLRVKSRKSEFCEFIIRLPVSTRDSGRETTGQPQLIR